MKRKRNIRIYSLIIIIITMILLSSMCLSCKADTKPNPDEHIVDNNDVFEEDENKEEIFSYSTGLSYVLENNGYFVAGIGVCKDVNLIIPSTYLETSVIGIAADAFNKNRKIKSITLPTSIKIIKQRAFLDCVSLSTVNFSDCVYLHTIGEKAFSRCENLKQLIMPESIESIEKEAFSGCVELSKIEPSENLISLGRHAFLGTLWYQEITEGVVYLGKVAYGVKFNQLEKEFWHLNIEEGCVAVASYAFFENDFINAITIPSSLEYLGEGALTGCPNLNSIEVSSGNPKFFSQGNCLLIEEEGFVKLVLGCKDSQIPSFTEVIGEYSFYNAKGLTNLTVPDNVTFVGESAFKKCISLNFISLEIATIEIETFSGCSNLKYFWVKEGVKDIRYGAFYGCDLLNEVYIESKEVLAALQGNTSPGNLLENVRTVYVKEGLNPYVNNFILASFIRMPTSEYAGFIKFLREN